MKLGLIGTNITNSLSPAIHNAALNALGICGSYAILQTEPPELSSRLTSCFNDGFDGLNITAPFKSDVLPLVESRSPLVDIICSANTLVRGKNGWHAESTDGAGVAFALSKWSSNLPTGHAVILGNGGFARAVAYELLTRGWKVSIYSRSQKNKDWAAISSLFETNISFCNWNDRNKVTNNTHLIVNASPIGSDTISTPLLLNLCFTSHVLYLDCLYNPRITPLMSTFSKNGSRTQNGINILLGQAAASFLMWTGIEFPDSIFQHWEVPV